MKHDTEHIHINAGEKVEIFTRGFSSVPMTYEFTASGLNESKLQGRIEVLTRSCMGRKKLRTIKLQANNAIKASIWDTFFTLFVVADEDIQVSLPIRKPGTLRMMAVLVVLVVAAASTITLLQIR